MYARNVQRSKRSYVERKEERRGFSSRFGPRSAREGCRHVDEGNKRAKKMRRLSSLDSRNARELINRDISEQSGKNEWKREIIFVGFVRTCFRKMLATIRVNYALIKASSSTIEQEQMIVPRSLALPLSLLPTVSFGARRHDFVPVRAESHQGTTVTPSPDNSTGGKN